MHLHEHASGICLMMIMNTFAWMIWSWCNHMFIWILPCLWFCHVYLLPWFICCFGWHGS